MKYKLAVALAIAAIMVLSVIPMVSDEADAHVINEKDAGVGFSVNNLSGDTLKKIFPQERQNGAAEYILTMMIKDNSDNYEITEVEVTDYDAAVYMGSSISGNVVNTVDSESLSYKITFKATRTSAPQGQLFFNEYQNAAIIKEVGLDNMSQEGAVFEVTSYLEFVLSYHTKYTYETNSAEDFVLTHKWEQYYNKQAVKYDVKYTFNNDGEKTISYTYDCGDEESERKDTSMDFCGVDVKDVDESKKVLLYTDIDQCAAISWQRVKIGGDEVGPTSYSYKPNESQHIKAYDSATVVKEDLNVADYKFYDAMDHDHSLFSGTDVDESLRDDSKMKQFLTDNGTVKDTFSSVEKAADSYYHDLTFTEDLKQAGLVIVAAFGAFIVTVIVIVIVIALLKRKK